MKQLYSSILAWSAVVTCFGQVTIDRPIVLTGTIETQRQVLGLPPLLTGTAANTAEVEQKGIHRYAVAVGGTVWQVDLPALAGAPAAGTQIMLSTVDNASMGPVQLLVNGLGPYDIIWFPGAPLLQEDVPAIPVLSLVFDGTAFQVLNGKPRSRRECPAGTVAVNEQFCMEIAERDTTSWFTAAQTCIAASMRLCTWGEWHNGCNKATQLGIQNTVGNWEWTNDTANEDCCVRIIGFSSCAQSGTWGVNNTPQYFRCCFTR